MITIIADPHRYRSAPPDAVRATDSSEYVAVRMAIRRALNLGQPLVIHVTDRLLLYWLDDLVEYHGVYWEVIAPETDFRRLFGVEPTPPFTADLLIELDISSMSAPPPRTAVEPAGWVLGERLHPLWAALGSNVGHLSQLVGWAIKYAEALPPSLHPLAQQCLTHWAISAPMYGTLRAGSLTADATNLIRRAALQHYDTAWLHEQGLDILPLVELKLSPELWIGALRELAPMIERYWREHSVQQPIDRAYVHAAVERMSGWSNMELRAIERLLTRNASLLDQSLMQALRHRFVHLPETGATLDELEALISPAIPELPDDTWSDEAWLRWATDSYMPYFAWTVRSQQPRDHQAACAAAYEAWLFRRYTSWVSTSGSPLITRQFTLLRDLLKAEPNALVVWLVVDGLAWWQGRMFRDICRHHGLHPQRYETGVAMLPSLTDISKRALVIGTPVSELPRGSIAQAAQEKLARVGVRGHVGYDAREALQAVQATEPYQCLIWFANTLDRLAHERSDFTDDSVVRGYLDNLAHTLGRMRSLCFEQGRPFHVLIGSDHGSTLLPAGSPTRKIPHAAREVVDVWEDNGGVRSTAPSSARAVQVNDAQQLQIDRPDEWYYLDPLEYQVPQDYLIPKGYAAVGRRPGGWTHGGLTPEETIVPLIHLAPEPLKLQNLTLTLSGRIQPRKEGVLTLLVINPNPAPLDSVVVRVADLAPVSVGRIPADGRYENTILVSARPIEGTELPLTWTLEGNALGVEHRQQGEARIGVRRLQTENSFDDLFG